MFGQMLSARKETSNGKLTPREGIELIGARLVMILGVLLAAIGIKAAF